MTSRRTNVKRGGWFEGGQCGGGMCMLREVVDIAYGRAQKIRRVSIRFGVKVEIAFRDINTAFVLLTWV